MAGKRGKNGIYRRGNRYRVVYDLGSKVDPATGQRTRRQRQKTFTTYAEARDFLADQRNAIHNQGRRADPGRMTVGDWLDEWITELEDEGRVRESTRLFYEQRVRNYLKPGLGSVRLRDLDAGTVRTYYRTLKPTIRAKVHQTLRCALNDAVAHERMSYNPALGLGRRSRTKDSEDGPERTWKAWSADQLRAFLHATEDDRLAALWRLYAVTGARRGELLGLRWADVDFARARISIERAYVEVGHTQRIQPTKSGRSRLVDVDTGTVVMLRRWKTQQSQDRLAAGPAWEPGDYVFTNLFGEPLKPEWTRRRFKTLVSASGLPDIRLHDVRHSFASITLGQGESVHVVSSRLGHAKPSITLNIYAHEVGDQQKDLASRVGELLAFETEAAAGDS